MGQLRDKIRTMVRNEFTSRMIEEAKKASKKYDSKTVYRSSKYIDLWNSFPAGKPKSGISRDATKHDFVRRMMVLLNKADQERSTSPIYLEPEQKAEALELLIPLVNDPDEFVETMNKERGLVFGQAYGKVVGGKLRSHPDPVAYLITQYMSDKDVLKSLDSVEADAPAAEPAKAAEEGEYDIIPGTTSKADIARSLSSDPTETTTEMSVLNRLKKAMKHLTNEQNLEILDFIKDPSVEKSEKASLMSDLEKITRLTKTAADKYSALFIDSMISAMKSVKDVEDDAQIDKAVLAGRKKFVDALKAADVFSPAVNKGELNPYEINVFADVLDRQEGRWTVLDMIVISAKKPNQAELFRDEAIAAAKEGFLEEMEKQTNFNSLGDFTDTLPEVKEIRANIFKTLEKRGRKKGSTKEVLAAKKAGKK
jgi:hypothetical protein